jgi:hypothetical protein
MLQKVRSAIDDRLKQRSKDTHAVFETFVGIDTLRDNVEDGELRKTYRNQDARPDDETDRRQMSLALFVEAHRRRAQIERSTIRDQTARRLDFAQGRFRRNLDAKRPFDELLFFGGRTEKINPDRVCRKPGADPGQVIDPMAVGFQHWIIPKLRQVTTPTITMKNVFNDLFFNPGWGPIYCK